MVTSESRPQTPDGDFAYPHALHAFFDIAEAIANIAGPHCDVVPHSQACTGRSAVKTVNRHVTGRGVGASITGLKNPPPFLPNASASPVTPSINTCVNSNRHSKKNKSMEMIPMRYTIITTEGDT